MPKKQLFSLDRDRDGDGDYATIRHYTETTRYEEDNEILVSVEQTGWVRVAVRDIGRVMLDRNIHEFYTEADIRMIESMAQGGD